MDASRQTQAALIERSNLNVGSMLDRFEKLFVLAPIGRKHALAKDDDPHEVGDLIDETVDEGSAAQRPARDRNITASETFQLKMETEALIRGAEEMISLNRSLKEAWLFGRLDTLGQSPAEKKTEELATAVATALPKLLGNSRSEEATAA